MSGKKLFLRILCLALVLAAVLPFAAACNGGGGETQSETKAPEELGVDPKWEGVRFEGTELVYNISVVPPTTSTYDAADKYIRVPEDMGSDEVLKKAYDRNARVLQTLGLTVRYQESDGTIDQAYETIKTYVTTNVDVPDVFNNDVYSLLHASYQGYLLNVKNPGEESYFDFGMDCWYNSFMEGTTPTPEKMYIIAGDCFMDMMRMAWVIYVNADLLREIYSGLYPEGLNDLYYEVQERYWDMENMAFLVEGAHIDSANEGFTDKDDEQIGFVGSGMLERLLTWNCGASVMEKVGGTYRIIESSQGLFDFSTAFTELYNTAGMMRVEQSLEAITLFMTNKYLFSMGHLGEMESEDIRNLEFDRGIVPMPLFDLAYSDYQTQVHDQAEIACILNNAKQFTAASAFLQLLCEESAPVLEEYYEDSLKLKYNSDPATKGIIDLINEKITTPFEAMIVREVVSGAYYGTRGTELYDLVLKSAKGRQNSFQSDYTSAVGTWEDNLEELLAMFAALD